jgi:hypothetical protein
MIGQYRSKIAESENAFARFNQFPENAAELPLIECETTLLRRRLTVQRFLHPFDFTRERFPALQKDRWGQLREEPRDPLAPAGLDPVIKKVC